MKGLVLFAHGARDPAWAAPLVRLRDRIQAAAPGTPIEIAFLEMMEPDLTVAARRLIDAGCASLAVVPIFLGQGGHVRRDLTALVEQLRSDHPEIRFDVAGAVGEDASVLDAIAAYCLAMLPAREDSHATA